MRVNHVQPRHFLKIGDIPGNHAQAVDQGGGGDDGIGEFDFVRHAQFNRLLGHRSGQFQHEGIVKETGQDLVAAGVVLKPSTSILVMMDTFGMSLTTPSIKAMPGAGRLPPPG